MDLTDPEAALSVEPAVLPSTADVEFYEQHGWFVSPELVAPSVLDELRVLLDEHQRRPASRRLDAAVGHTDWDPGDGEGVRNSEFLSVQCRAMRRLSLAPVLGAVAARLSRSASVRLFDDQAVVKPPGGVETVVGWHTDHSYWSTCTSRSMLTAWIPFDDVDETGGGLMVVDGSHLWPDADLRGFNTRDLAVDPAMAAHVVPLRLKKGQVSFHHMRLVHASGPNRSDRTRAAVAVHLQDEGNRYRRFHTGDGQLVVLPHDRLCGRGPDGEPDYSDPAVFPLVWEKGGRRG